MQVGCPGKITINRPLWIASVNDPPAGKAVSPKNKENKKKQQKKGKENKRRKERKPGKKKERTQRTNAHRKDETPRRIESEEK